MRNWVPICGGKAFWKVDKREVYGRYLINGFRSETQSTITYFIYVLNTPLRCFKGLDNSWQERAVVTCTIYIILLNLLVCSTFLGNYWSCQSEDVYEHTNHKAQRIKQDGLCDWVIVWEISYPCPNRSYISTRHWLVALFYGRPARSL